MTDEQLMREMDIAIEYQRQGALMELMTVNNGRTITFILAMALEQIRVILNGAPRPELAEYFRTKVLEVLSDDLESKYSNLL